MEPGKREDESPPARRGFRDAPALEEQVAPRKDCDVGRDEVQMERSYEREEVVEDQVQRMERTRLPSAPKS